MRLLGSSSVMELIGKRTDHLPAKVQDSGPQMPTLIASSGDAARFAWEEFVYGKLRNEHTRRSYGRAIHRFLAWCDAKGLKLLGIAPRDVGSYLDGLNLSPVSKKLCLSALRHFFDQLVVRHVVILNPAASVRSERLQVIEGKTPEITVAQARRLLAAIDTSRLVGLRDRAIIGTLIYTAARVGAVAGLRCGDFYDLGDQHCLRLTEKGTKSREIPVRHDLRGFIAEYLDATGIRYADKSAPLFRTTVRRTGRLTMFAMTPGDIARMVKRRLRDTGLPDRLSPHSFRVATITNLLSQGIALQDVQLLAGHADPRTTRLYDRRHRQVTRNIVERISI
jgi:site-specific recombinase XerD